MPLNLNRIVTIRGFTESSIVRPRRYGRGFTTNIVEQSVFPDGTINLISDFGWAAAATPLQDATSLLALSDLLTATHLFFASGYTDENDDQQVQRPVTVAQFDADLFKQLFVLSEDGDIEAEFEASSYAISATRSGIGGYWVYEAAVSNGKMIADAITGKGLGYSSDVIQAISNVDIQEKRVWAQIDELGTTAGLIQVEVAGFRDQTTSGDGPEDAFVTGVQNEARLLTRYDPSIVNGYEVIDDLGRQWAVASSRTLADRRFTEYQLFRTLRAEDA